MSSTVVKKAGGGEKVGGCARLPDSRSWALSGWGGTARSDQVRRYVGVLVIDSLLRIGGISKYFLFFYTLAEETYSSCQWILNINKFISFDGYVKVHP
jgi:hypothetical protein